MDNMGTPTLSSDFGVLRVKGDSSAITKYAMGYH